MVCLILNGFLLIILQLNNFTLRQLITLYADHCYAISIHHNLNVQVSSLYQLTPWILHYNDIKNDTRLSQGLAWFAVISSYLLCFTMICLDLLWGPLDCTGFAYNEYVITIWNLLISAYAYAPVIHSVEQQDFTPTMRLLWRLFAAQVYTIRPYDRISSMATHDDTNMEQSDPFRLFDYWRLVMIKMALVFTSQ